VFVGTKQCAVGILFLIELLLLRFGQVPTVGLHIGVFLLLDRPVVGLQLLGLRRGQPAAPDSLIDEGPLIRHPLVDFVTAMMLSAEAIPLGADRVSWACRQSNAIVDGRPASAENAAVQTTTSTPALHRRAAFAGLRLLSRDVRARAGRRTAGDMVLAMMITMMFTVVYPLMFVVVSAMMICMMSAVTSAGMTCATVGATAVTAATVATPAAVASTTTFGKGRHRQRNRGYDCGEEHGSGHGSAFRFKFRTASTH
jgi:hypothetical protein